MQYIYIYIYIYKGHACLEVFLSQVEKEIFEILSSDLNMSREEWQAVRSLANDRSIVIKKADKGSCVVAWDRNDYLQEAERQVTLRFTEMLVTLKISSVSYRKQVIECLIVLKRGFLTENQMKYFTYEFKKATKFDKLYLLPKIHKEFHNVPGRPVISNCGSPTENCSEFLDHHLKSIMQKGWSCIKNSGDFISKTKNLGTIPDTAILVTADLVGLYHSIPREAGLRAIREALDKQEVKCIPTEDLLKTWFALKNSYFEFKSKIKQQVSGTAIVTKFAPPYACLFMDKFATSFLETQQLQPLVWFRYIDDIFFIWTHGEEKLKIFLNSLNEFDPCIKFTYESNKESIAFLDIKVSLRNGKVFTDLYVKPTDQHQYIHYLSAHPYHTKK